MTDWDLYYRHERLHRRHEPLDFRRWKRASQVALRGLYQAEGVRILDSTSGLGDHTVNLAELGFVTEACDSSSQARESTREALASAGLDVPVHDAQWESLGATFPSRFDLVWNDAIHWLETDERMHAALVGLRGALKPRGALVFFFADARHPEENAGMAIHAWDREHLRPHELAWSHRDGDTDTTHIIARQPTSRHIDEHHLYVRTQHGQAQLESLLMRRIYRWDWHAMARALIAAGYEDLRSDRFLNDNGDPFTMNRAHQRGSKRP